MIDSDNGAVMAGYTKEMTAKKGDQNIHVLVKPSTVLTDAFTAYDCDECEMIRFQSVYGWTFEEIASTGQSTSPDS